MGKVTNTSARKSDHIHINLKEDVASNLTNGLERYRFVHRALPELNLEEVDSSLSIFNKTLNIPLLISSMTGGTKAAAEINHILAYAAQETGIAMGVGSQRAAIENPKFEDTFFVRDVAPDILLFANLGAVQLNYGYGINECIRAVDMIEADALILHLNALQEALQPEGDTRFKGIINKIERICGELHVPVIAKEVGWGFSQDDVRMLIDAGISAIDVAGAGGTSWSQVEMHRAQNESQARIAASFIGWGVPTSEVITIIRDLSNDLKIFASGGIQDGIDICKCIALGAEIGGIAGPFLKTAADSLEKTVEKINEIQHEIHICMFSAGAGNLEELKNTKLIEKTGD
jgi:isopentenyl-diphosphate delta-isomerase